jgi:predicted Fe-Mo cluster-binding NifX family protein
VNVDEEVGGATARDAEGVDGVAAREVENHGNDPSAQIRRDNMRIAVSSQGTGLEAQVDPRFGRAKWFILYDTDTGESETLSNDQVLNLPQGAGIQAAQHVINRKVEAVLTGHCGPNAFQTLTAAGVQVVLGASGTVEQAAKRFQEGELKAASAPDVAGHS